MAVNPNVMLDIQKAVQGTPFEDKIACHKEDIFLGAIAGMEVLCSATVVGQSQPLQGLLSRDPLNDPNAASLSGFLTQWVSSTDPVFNGDLVPVGHISIARASNDVTLIWGGKTRQLDGYCLNTTLGGTDSLGDVWTIELSTARLY